MKPFFKIDVLTVFLLFALFPLLSSCLEDKVEPVLYGSLKGQVTYESNGEAAQGVEGVAITTNPASEIILTDSEGNFVFDSLRVGDYNVIAKKEGFIGNASQLVIEHNKETNITIELLKVEQKNTVPVISQEISPKDGAKRQAVDVTLAWNASDSNPSDKLTFDVFLFKDEGKQIIAENISDTSLVVSDLAHQTTYFWQIIVKDNQGEQVNGPVWSFSTIDFPDNEFFFSRKIGNNYEIFSSDINEDSLVQLTSRSGRDWAPRYNRTNKKIAFVSNDKGQNYLYTMDADGKDIKQVSNLPVTGYHHEGGAFCWTANGSQLLFSHYNKLYRINADGSGLSLVATAPADRHFRKMDYSDQEKKILVETVGLHPWDTEIYLLDEGGTNMRMLVGNQPGVIQSPAFSIDGKEMLFTLDQSGFQSASGRQLDTDIFLLTISDSTVTNLSVNKEPGTNDLNPRFSPNGNHVIFMNSDNNKSDKSKVMSLPINTNLGIDEYERKLLFDNAFVPEWK